MKTKEFPYKPIGRLAKKSGVKRISESGVRALRNAVLDEANNKAKEIVMIAKYAGRKTVMKEDVTFIIKKSPPI